MYPGLVNSSHPEALEQQQPDDSARVREKPQKVQEKQPRCKIQ